jgi:hypothetical protein
MTRSVVSLVVMARVPEQERVKTRLQAVFSAPQVLALYRAMLRDTLELASGIPSRHVRTAVYWSGDRTAVPAEWAEAFPQFAHRLQRGVNLGERLLLSLSEWGGVGPVMALGCDSPTLPAEYLARAVAWLREERLPGEPEGCALPGTGPEIQPPDLVLGPSEDGGYYLIGMRTLVGALFEGIDWGTGKVLAQSLARARNCSLRTCLLPEWHDLDTVEDLAKVAERRAVAHGSGRHIHRCLTELGIPNV